MPVDYALNYTGVALAAAVAFGGVGALFVLARLIAPRRATALSTTVYECGIMPTGPGQAQYSLRYYLFALLFLIFEVEAVFIFPWVLVYLLPEMGATAFYEMVFFLGILLFGLLYAWRKGVLQWQ